MYFVLGVIYGGAEDFCAYKKGKATGSLLHRTGAIPVFEPLIKITAYTALV